MIGEVLGSRYEILEKIGEGGMSIVYKARCNKLNRNVAVKVLKKELCDNPDIVNKFKREATAIATLSDNNIVNVLDVGSQDDINYIVMEYVQGKTLKQVIKEFGKLNYESTVKIGIQIARALECAHKNNIIHRDVKPQNVLVTDDGVIKVTDFGIAKSSDSSTLTNTTTIMGSAQYFSPEQAKGSFVDARTDLYSLGVVLYEMSTGKLPFDADSPVTIALKHIQEEPIPPKQVNSRIPESLNILILKLMEKDPSKRYQSAREVITDLEKIKEDPNAIIGDDKKDDNGKTIVMEAVNPVVDSNTSNNKKDSSVDSDDDFYDYDDDYDYDDEEDEKPKSKSSSLGQKKKMIIGIIAVAAVLILGVVGVFSLNNSSAKEVTIPDIKGMTLTDAKKSLSDVGLVLEEAGTEESSEPEGTILEVNPEPGSTAKKGDKVRVIVSGGETKIPMPDVVGESIDDAKSDLEKAKLTNYKISYETSDYVDSGYVISTDPEASESVTEDTAITIVVSKGPAVKYVKVPSIIGVSQSTAAERLSNAGLGVSIEQRTISDKSQNGMVIDASEGVGNSVKSGTTVTIYVGVYKAEENTTNNQQNQTTTGNKSDGGTPSTPKEPPKKDDTSDEEKDKQKEDEYDKEKKPTPEPTPVEPNPGENKAKNK